MELSRKAVTILICLITITFWFLLLNKTGTPAFLLDTLFLIILAIVSICDLHTMEIPDSCQLALLILGILSSFLVDASLLSRLLGFFLISLPFLLIAVLFGGFGGGDIKLCAVCGFYLGAPLIAIGTLLAAVTAACYAVILLIFQKAGAKDSFCFGPFLALGFVISLLFGDRILTQYLLLLL